MELEGRVALITGASRGIGQGIAKSMAEAGANIVVNYQRNKAGAEQTASDVEALGAKALVYQANVKNLNEVQAMVDKSVEAFGTVDILINNAGQHYSKSVIADDALDVFPRRGRHAYQRLLLLHSGSAASHDEKEKGRHPLHQLPGYQAAVGGRVGLCQRQVLDEHFCDDHGQGAQLARDPGQRHCTHHRGVGYGSETGHGLGKVGRPAEPGRHSSLSTG